MPKVDLEREMFLLRGTWRSDGRAMGGAGTAVAQKEPPGGVGVEPDDHGLGRSRGGLTTKLRLAVEQGR
ncbi:hypothetical protein ACFSL4_13415 [Streptomyces caeni]|uniref:Uncharacterized protein n=1 Tax=Streptomyces caeni TaxID=2307231 RepID=A0ABW4IPB9_9ACTN